MLLAGSDLLEGLHTVVLDEVHFIQDPYRGGVWEEVLVLSPARDPLRLPLGHRQQRRRARRLAALGPRGHRRDRRAPPADRPAPPLRRAPAGGRRDAAAARCCRTTGKPAGEGLRIDQAVRRALQGRPGHWQRRGDGALACPTAPPGAPRWSRSSTHRDMLPAIVFIFSRAACDDAVRQVVRDGVRLTDAARAHRHPPGGRAPGRAARRRRPGRARLRRVARGPRARRGRAPRRAGPGLPRDGGGVLRRRAAQGRLRHRDAVARDQHAGPLRGHRALHQVRRRRPGHADLGRVPPAHRAGPAAAASTRRATPSWPGRARPPSPRRPGSPRPRRRTCARPSGPPTTWPSTWSSRFDRDTADAVLQRSFAQWQARKPDLLLRQLGHRVAVLEQHGLPATAGA